MGKVLDAIDDAVAAFIARQHVFFVATAPRADDGHVNVSPKGGDTFRILGPRQVAYLDLTGSGVETIAHVRENGRIVVMFCAFEGPPDIVRLHGRGTVLLPGDGDYSALAAGYPPNAGARAILRIDVTRVATSCGYAVPLFEYVGDRDQLDKWVERKGSEGLTSYRSEKNARSIDGLKGLEP